MKLNDFLKAELLGNKFVAVKGFSEVLDRETQKLSAYRPRQIALIFLRIRLDYGFRSDRY